jgi:CBS domain-containing protein
MAFTVGDMMSAQIPTIGSGESVRSAAQGLARAHYGVLPVVKEDGTLTGLFGMWDVVSLVAQEIDIDSTPTGDVVHGSVAITPGEPLARAGEVMSQESLVLLPVVEGDRFVGAVTHNALEAAQRLEDDFGALADRLITEISPADNMHGGLHAEYLLGGMSALRCIQAAMSAANTGDPATILDLACGWGRVMRFVKAEWPDASLAACDLERDAVDFCARVFGATPIYSAVEPGEVRIEGEFDLIWSGSLFTHLEKERWLGFLNLAAGCLAPGGLFVFTANAKLSGERLRGLGLPDRDIASILRDFDESGFGYVDYTGIKDYGIAMAARRWVRMQIAADPRLDLVSYAEREWGPAIPKQDVIACIRREPAAAT